MKRIMEVINVKRSKITRILLLSKKNVFAINRHKTNPQQIHAANNKARELTHLTDFQTSKFFDSSKDRTFPLRNNRTKKQIQDAFTEFQTIANFSISNE